MKPRAWQLALVLFAMACSDDGSPASPADAASKRDGGRDASGSYGDAGSARQDAGSDAAPAMDAGADAGPEVTPELCDGSNTVRLRYGIMSPPDRLPLGDHVMYQNGGSYWVITGSCHYYVMLGAWKEVREGDLSHARAQRIARGAHYGRLNELAGAYGPLPTEPVFDGGTLRLGSATQIINCYAKCDTAPAPAQEAMDFAYSRLTTLYEDGTPVHGPIRMSLIRYDFPGPSPMTMSTAQMAVPWPLTSVQPDVVAIRKSDPRLASGYTGTLIEVDNDVQALRDLRDAIWADEFGPARQWQAYGFFWIWGDTMLTRYELRFRDTIPLEDENGDIQMEFDGLADADAGI